VPSLAPTIGGSPLLQQGELDFSPAESAPLTEEWALQAAEKVCVSPEGTGLKVAQDAVLGRPDQNGPSPVRDG
jgi:hypothetical protein